MMLIRVAREKSLPFDPLIPNEETLQAMKDARDGKTSKGFKTTEELLSDLNA